MIKYIVKRLLMLVPVLLGVAFVIFTMLFFTPGDPAISALGTMASPEALAECRSALERAGIGAALRGETGRIPQRTLRRARLDGNAVAGGIGVHVRENA